MDFDIFNAGTSGRLKYSIKLLKPFRLTISMLFIFICVESLLSLALPYYISQIVHALFITQGEHNLILAGSVVLALLFIAVSKYCVSYNANMIGAGLITQFSQALFNKITKLNLGSLQSQTRGKLVALFSHDINVLAYFLSGFLASIIPTFILLVGSIIMIASISINIAVLQLVFVPGFYFLLKWLGREIKPLSNQVLRQQSHIVANINEVLSNIKLIKMFAGENLEKRHFANYLVDLEKKRSEQLKIQSALAPFTQFLVSTGLIALIYLSSVFVASGQLAVNSVVSLLLYGLMFARQVSIISNMYGQIQQAKAAFSRLQALTRLPTEIYREKVIKVTSKAEIPNGDIEFKSVNFSYGSNQFSIENLSFVIPQGKIFAIVGENGAGKTTVLELIMRFYLPTSGSILIANQPIQKYKLDEYRKRFAWVSQDSNIFDESVLYNLVYPGKKVDEDKINHILVLVGLSKFVQSLEHGLETQVGEQGVQLSGGQKQKIALARALLSEADFYIFDEPTSMIDDNGKLMFEKILTQTLKDKTVILVTHDLHIAQIANQQLNLKQAHYE